MLLVDLPTPCPPSSSPRYTFGNDEDLGFSTVKATCLDNLTPTHQYGHNLGCQVDRESTSVDTDYAHGLRYCDGEDP